MLPHSGFGVGVAVGVSVGDGVIVGVGVRVGVEVIVGVGLSVGVGVVYALHVPSTLCSSHTPHFDTVTTLHTYVWLIFGVNVTFVDVVVPVLIVLLLSVLSMIV